MRKGIVGNDHAHAVSAVREIFLDRSAVLRYTAWEDKNWNIRRSPIAELTAKARQQAAFVKHGKRIRRK